MTDDHAALLHEIESLLAALSADEFEASLERVDETLTAGYAHALALEAERGRLERRLRELAADVAAARDDSGTREELAALAPRLSASADELRRLRGVLAALRVRASALRAQAAAY